MKESVTLSKRKRKELWFYILMIFLPIVQFCIFYIFVNMNAILLSFKAYKADEYVYNGLKNFKELFTLFKKDPIFSTSFKNSLISYLICTLFSLPLGLLFSNYIYKKFVGGKLFKVILFLPAIIPVVVMTRVFGEVTDSIIPALARRFDQTTQLKGFLNEPDFMLSTIIFYTIWTGFGTTTLLYVGSMTTISESVVEAAKIDGVNATQELLFITLPYIWPTLVTFITVGIAGIFNNQFNVYTFYNREANISIYNIGYYLYSRTVIAGYADYPILATFGVVLTLIVAPVSLTVNKILNKVGPKV